jgi:hypothetical protein
MVLMGLMVHLDVFGSVMCVGQGLPPSGRSAWGSTPNEKIIKKNHGIPQK